MADTAANHPMAVPVGGHPSAAMADHAHEVPRGFDRTASGVRSRVGSGCRFRSSEGRHCTRGSDGDPRPEEGRRYLHCDESGHMDLQRRHAVRRGCRVRGGGGVEALTYWEAVVEEDKIAEPKVVLRHAWRREG